MKKKAIRRKVDYKLITRMWNRGKTVAEIAKAIRRDEHATRVVLTRMHSMGLPYRVKASVVKLAIKAGKKAARG